MFLYRVRAYLQRFGHFGIFHALQVAHAQNLVGGRGELGEHLRHKAVGVAVVGHLAVVEFCLAQIFLVVLRLPRFASHDVDGMVVHGGEEIRLHVAVGHFVEMTPQVGKHVAEQILARIVVVDDVQGKVIQLHVVCSVYCFESALLGVCSAYVHVSLSEAAGTFGCAARNRFFLYISLVDGGFEPAYPFAKLAF